VSTPHQPPPRSVPKVKSVVNPSTCEHKWIQDFWMSGHTLDTHPKLENETDIGQLHLIPLFRCVECGLIRLPTAEDAAPPADPGAP